ncbi:MAG TPA: ligase-associated DNA damage response endonuclease PdeM [Burkholderiales bacterium]|nr:ligase-associated DNA damage response endonuclease PdeM [Burkholderiales bacterium]
MTRQIPHGAFETTAAGESLWLLPERAAYWPREQTLLIADAHLGKAAAFRREGVAVPAGTTDENLRKLSELIDAFTATRLVFLGDMLHNKVARDATARAFTRWRERHAALEVTLVRGNHDKRAGDPPREWDVECVDEPWLLDGLALCHMPQTVPDHYAIAGHVHPSVRLAGRGRELVRLPCFFFGSDYAILPAFGPFTGMAGIEPEQGDRVYVVAGSSVIAVAE